jgi:Glycosyl hydrolase family 57
LSQINMRCRALRCNGRMFAIDQSPPECARQRLQTSEQPAGGDAQGQEPRSVAGRGRSAGGKQPRAALIMASAARPLKLVLLWHMHQPEYRDYASGEFRQPWAYLHAMKDYSDMAWHLERHPGTRAVVNSSRLRDSLLRLLARLTGEPLGDAERSSILEHCFGADDERRLQRGARQLFEEPGAIETVARHARRGFSRHLAPDGRKPALQQGAHLRQAR